MYEVWLNFLISNINLIFVTERKTVDEQLFNWE